MSDERSSMSSDSEKLFQNIGERLKKQREKEAAEEDGKKEEINEQEKAAEEPESEDSKNKNSSTKEKKSSEKKNPKRAWQRQEEYQTSFKVKPEMEDDFNDCKRKFRRELNLLLSKQDAIELGWVLLKNLDESYFEELRVSYSPEDDLIEALKELIEEFY